MRGVNLKQIDGQVFLQQGWVYSGYQQRISIRAVLVSCVQIPTQQGRENFYTEEKGFGRATVNRVHGFSWLSPC